ncbi:MAG: zinc ribbon domain-containing protein [Methanobrevibacter sp.]|uniref:zinc ribbon domain-containing protein n=1 Tax=Methanobrevibacter sp. TaxID=66852 RepID=UPI0026E10B14|nr:zinc ribbon domain-containing protein [Methanobrevibacter sp.]MDO5849098.1 zinc ribbon domain-containing protein [Methanobrevibacter sp.]
MKTCHICGTENFETNNYCVHCGNRITKINICPCCGEINDDMAKFCKYCSFQLNPIDIESFDDLFSEYNTQLLADYNLTPQMYVDILNSVFEKLKYTKVKGKTIKEKILNLCGVFARCYPKCREGELGHNFGNVIFYDERLDDSSQISALLHELAHCILFNLISSLLCEIFNVNHSPFIDSFVWFFLSNDDMLLLNEYCASTVSGRFVPYGFQDYGSFKAELKRREIDEQSLEKIIKLSINFSNEICSRLDNYIDEALREDIKFQFKLDQKAENSNAFDFEILSEFDFNDKNKLLLEYLLMYFVAARLPEFREELCDCLQLFE